MRLVKHASSDKADKNLNAGEELVSSDVVSLFTKISVDLALIVGKRDSEEMLSWLRTNNFFLINQSAVFCLKTLQFPCKGTFYQQVSDTAMDSPVSAVIANKYGNVSSPGSRNEMSKMSSQRYQEMKRNVEQCSNRGVVYPIQLRA